MNILKTISLAAVAMVATAATAQDLKFAHVDTQALMSSLPEQQAAQATLQEEAKKLEDQLTVMNSDLQQKYEDYMAKRDSMPDLIRATKEKEIQDANQRIMSYQQMAQQSLSQKEQQLLMPIIEKVQNALNEVGKENGFVYIFDISSQVILYHSEQSVDAAPLVRAKLGVK
ncbi:MAG: OmpH family outer membrane protein [Bacteroidales bacterium]|nr:OmpH family outer membrane protein [Bacteroidales bacterium]